MISCNLADDPNESYSALTSSGLALFVSMYGPDARCPKCAGCPKDPADLARIPDAPRKTICSGCYIALGL